MDVSLLVQRTDGTPRGGIVLFEEGFAVNDHIIDVGRRVAGEGYLTVIPHLSHRSGDPVFPNDGSTPRPMESRTPERILAAAAAAAECREWQSLGPREHRCREVLRGRNDRSRHRRPPRHRCTRDVLLSRCRRGAVGSRHSSAKHRVASAMAQSLQRSRCRYSDRRRGAFASRSPSVREAGRGIRYASAGPGFSCDERRDFEAESTADAWRRELRWFDDHLAAWAAGSVSSATCPITIEMPHQDIAA